MITGSLDMLESPITRIFLVGSSDQFRLLFPLWGWWVKSSHRGEGGGGDGGKSKSTRVRGLEQPGNAPPDVKGGGLGYFTGIRNPDRTTPCVPTGGGRALGGGWGGTSVFPNAGASGRTSPGAPPLSNKSPLGSSISVRSTGIIGRVCGPG